MSRGLRERCQNKHSATLQHTQSDEKLASDVKNMCISLLYIYISTYNYLYNLIYPFPIFYLFPNLSRTFNTILEPRYLPSTNSPPCRALHRPGPPNRGGRRGRRGPQGLRGPRPRAEERPRRPWRGKSRCGVKLEQEPNGWRYGSVSKPCTPGEHQNSW
jgi:hypothetical protein